MFAGFVTYYDENKWCSDLKMSKTISGSKKFSNISALKASIMDFTGYTSGMNVGSDNWQGSNEKENGSSANVGSRGDR